MINYIIKEYSDILNIFSKIILFRFFYVSFVIFFLYNLPLILTYKFLLNGEPFFLKTIIYNLFIIFFKGPMYIILYFYSNRKLKQILKDYRGDLAPSHMFATIVINITYLLIYICWYMMTGVMSIIPMGILYSLYISQLSYNFIDNVLYKFENPITFYNSNTIFFCILGFIYSCIEYFYLIHYNLEILGLFFYTLICFPLLITYKYKNNPNSTNYFYFSEKVLNMIT